MKKLLFAAIFASFLSISSESFAEPPTSATDIVRKAEMEVRKRSKLSVDISQVLESLIDYEKIAQESLSINWVTASVSQRSEFLDLFKSLIRKSYERNLKHAASYHTEWRGEEKVDKGVLVLSDVVKNDGREEPLHVVYKVVDSKVVDIITEDSSMVSRYKSQFKRIIFKSGFEGLLVKMREKSVKD